MHSVHLQDPNTVDTDDDSTVNPTEAEVSNEGDEEINEISVCKESNFAQAEFTPGTNLYSSSDSDEVELIKVEKTKKLIEKNDYKIPRRKNTPGRGRSQSLLRNIDPLSMVPLKTTQKGIKANRNH